jgi:hypothetical protein
MAAIHDRAQDHDVRTSELLDLGHVPGGNQVVDRGLKTNWIPGVRARALDGARKSTRASTVIGDSSALPCDHEASDPSPVHTVVDA